MRNLGLGLGIGANHRRSFVPPLSAAWSKFGAGADPVFDGAGGVSVTSNGANSGVQISAPNIVQNDYYRLTFHYDTIFNNSGIAYIRLTSGTNQELITPGSRDSEAERTATGGVYQSIDFQSNYDAPTFSIFTYGVSGAGFEISDIKILRTAAP